MVIYFINTGVSCGEPPSQPLTTRHVTGHLYRDTVTYSCIQGHYVSSGTATRTCQHDRTWSGSPPVCSSKVFFLFFCYKIPVFKNRTAEPLQLCE